MYDSPNQSINEYHRIVDRLLREANHSRATYAMAQYAYLRGVTPADCAESVIAARTEANHVA